MYFLQGGFFCKSNLLFNLDMNYGTLLEKYKNDLLKTTSIQKHRNVTCSSLPKKHHS